MNPVDAVIAEILDIAETYHEQVDERGYPDSPGGMEHMGDVWGKILKWEKMLNG